MDLGREAEFNYGVTVTGPADITLENPERTYVVLGVSRGGTSAVAGMLNLMGVHMGGTGEAPLYEDLRMNRALDAGSANVEELIQLYDRQRTVWGFKGNAIRQPYAEFAARLRNPIFVVVFRDLLAIANRASLSADRDVTHILVRQAAEYQRIVDFVANGGYYCVLVSYEKLTGYPREVAVKLACHCGLQPDSRQLAKAVEFIRPAPEDYLVVSRATPRSGK
ncbi:MAG: hypothetical protein P8Y92_18000 [Halioglobus sp.]|jgi:hypothetical protein